MNDDDYLHSIFRGPWCPICGDIPETFDLEKFDPLKEIAAIIRQARLLLNFGEEDYIGEPEDDNNYPTLESIEKDLDHYDFSLNDVVMYRDIFRLSRTIAQYTDATFSNRSKNIRETLAAARSFVHMEIDPRAPERTPQYTKAPYIIEEASDVEILAVLAIEAAYSAAKDFYYGNEQASLDKARNFLDTAIQINLIIGEEERDNLEITNKKLNRKLSNANETIEFQLPLVDTEMKMRPGRSLGGSIRSAKFAARNKVWQKEADSIWGNNPDLTKNDVAKIIMDKFDGWIIIGDIVQLANQNEAEDYNEEEDFLLDLGMQYTKGEKHSESFLRRITRSIKKM